MKPHLLILALLLTLTACVTPRDPRVWYQPGKTVRDLQRDWAASQLAARRAALRYSPPTVNDNDAFAAGMAWRAQRDAARAAEEIAPLTMQSKGYQLVPRSTVPAGEFWLQP